MKRSIVRTIVSRVLLVALCLVVRSTPSAAETETYLFRDTFAPIEGGGNVLVPVSNDTGTILSTGPSFVNGTFVDESISPTACASTPTVRAWSFPNEAGLGYPNAAPQLVTGSYSISMLLRFNPMDGGYARLIDFSNSTLDTGIYKYVAGVSFYPVGTYAAGSFVQDQDVFVTVTRDGGSKLVSLYINGTPSGTYTDTGDLYAPSATIVYLLMDNTTGSAHVTETDPGTIAYLQIRDTPMTAEQVAASLATICQTVVCGTNGAPACPGPCDAAAPGSFEAILCRLDALLARVQGESALGSFQTALARQIQNAKARTLDAQKIGTGKKAKKKLQQAAKFVSAYIHRLGSRTARKKLDATLRTDFMDDGTPILQDLKALRGTL